MKHKKLITSLHIAKGLFCHVVFGKSGHWEKRELLNETTARGKRKNGNMKRKEKGRQGANNDMLCEWSGRQERRQITIWSENSRKEINIIHTTGHKSRRNATYNEGKHH